MKIDSFNEKVNEILKHTIKIIHINLEVGYDIVNAELDEY